MTHLHHLDSADLSWLKRLAHALLRERHAADDLVQDTIVVALESKDDDASASRSWLAAVARKLAARRIRTDVRRTRREAHASPTEPAPDSADLVARAEIAERLAAAARRLPEPFRRTILLRFLDGLDTNEIAAREERPVDTVRHRVRRGLALLRKDLEQRDRNWAARCAMLAPLADMQTATGLATAGAASSTLVAATWITMKTKLLGAAALVAIACGTAWWFANEEPTPDANDPNSARVVAQNETTATSPTPASASPTLERESVTSPDTPTVPRDARLLSDVVDEVGAAIAGATVFAIDPDRSGQLWQTTTDRDGSFHPPTGDKANDTVDLGVLADGFLRHVETDAILQDGVHIVLRRGRTLQGRVVDEFGRGVSDLALLVHTTDARLEHASPSQVLWRARKAQFGGRASAYQQSRATTDANGAVTFTGLPAAEVRVHSSDPGWTIESPTKVQVDGNYITWTAKRRLGVELTVVDAATDTAIDLARARFYVELTFADGATEKFGKWVGRGAGGVSFVLGPGCFLPSFEGRVITRATFHGDVRSDGGEPTRWRAPPLEDGAGASGVARVRVAVDVTPVGPSETPDLPMTSVELDVRYADGTPFRGPLRVDWTARPIGGGKAQRDATTLSRNARGRYGLQVPAGSITLSAQESGASGSLPAWTGELFGYAGRAAATVVTLPRGGIAAIRRPEGWSGTWFVHASWRPVGEERWRGSWYHGTDSETMELTGVKPAQWRFLLRRDSATEGDALERIVSVAAGERVAVD